MKRFVLLVIKVLFTAFVALSIAFFSLNNLSGDSADVLASTMGNTQQLRVDMGLDMPVEKRFFLWIGAIFSGDLGTSSIYGVPVSSLLWQRIKVSFPLAAMAFLISMVLGTFMAVISVAKPRAIFSASIAFFLSVPVVWLGLAFLYIFSVKLPIFPSGGNDSFTSYILPSITLGIGQAAVVARYGKIALSDIEHKAFIHAAQLRGLSKGRALWKHGLPAVSVTLLSILGLQFSFLLTGVVIVERLFSMPGLGQLLYNSIMVRDVQVAGAAVGLMATIVFVVNTLADVLAYWLTPKLRRGYR